MIYIAKKKKVFAMSSHLTRLDGRDGATFLSRPGDRCVLPHYELAVGNIVQWKRQFLRSYRLSDIDGEMKGRKGGCDGREGRCREVEIGRRPSCVLNVS